MTHRQGNNEGWAVKNDEGIIERQTVMSGKSEALRAYNYHNVFPWVDSAPLPRGFSIVKIRLTEIKSWGGK